MRRPLAAGRWLLPYLGLTTFLTAIGNLGLVSVMPAIGRLIAIPDHLVAGIFSLSALVWAVSSPLWAKPVAHRGTAFFIRAGLVGFTLSNIGCAIAVELGLIGVLAPMACFLAFLVLRSIFGLLGAAQSIATQALVAHRTDGADRTAALTSLAGALSLGTIVGPAIAPFLMLTPLGPVGPMAVFGLIGALSWLGTYLVLPRTTGGTVVPDKAAPPPSTGLVAAWVRPGIRGPLAFGLMLCSAQAILMYTIGFVLIDRIGAGPLAAQDDIGLTMAAGASAALAAQWGLPRIVRIAPRSMMLIGSGFVVIGLVAPLFSATGLAAMIGFVVVSLGNGLARPGFAAAASLAGSHDDQVAIATAITLIAGASISVPPVIAAFAYREWPAAPFAIALALLLVGVLSLAGRGSRAIVHSQR